MPPLAWIIYPYKEEPLCECPKPEQVGNHPMSSVLAIDHTTDSSHCFVLSSDRTWLLSFHLLTACYRCLRPRLQPWCCAQWWRHHKGHPPCVCASGRESVSVTWWVSRAVSWINSHCQRSGYNQLLGNWSSLFFFSLLENKLPQNGLCGGVDLSSLPVVRFWKR